jgi:hypothetical protein
MIGCLEVLFQLMMRLSLIGKLILAAIHNYFLSVLILAIEAFKAGKRCWMK